MPRLQHVAVTFPPGGEAAVRAFYSGALGLAELPVPAEVAHLGWIWFAIDEEGVELHFVPHPVAPDADRVHHFCLEVDDLAAARTRLEGVGASLREAGARVAGRERAFVRDPLGNLVELMELDAPSH